MRKFLLDKFKYLVNHLTGKKAVAVMLTMAFLWYNHPEGTPFTETEVLTAAGLTAVLLGSWAFEKSNKANLR